MFDIPSKVDNKIAPAAAIVFIIESAYFNVAATNNPPPAPRRDTNNVSILQFDHGTRVISVLGESLDS